MCVSDVLCKRILPEMRCRDLLVITAYVYSITYAMKAVIQYTEVTYVHIRIA